MMAAISSGDCRQTRITLLAPTFLKEVICALVVKGSKHGSLFWLPHCLVTLDMKNNTLIHCFYKCGFFMIVLVNQHISCKLTVGLGLFVATFLSHKVQKRWKIGNRNHASGNR